MLSNMLSPDAIHDTALLTVSAWQRETTQERANRLLWRDQAERAERQFNRTPYQPSERAKQ